MDPFKLLTRSAKIKKSENHSQARKLPSEGQNASPQLYGQHDGQTSIESKEAAASRKRKREESGHRGNEIPAELDFFREEQPKVATRKKRDEGGHKGRSSNRPSLNIRQESPAASLPSLSLSDCKRILKTHKVKVIQLATSKQGRPSGKDQKIRKDQNDKNTKNHDKQEIFPTPLLSFGDLRQSHGISRRLAENIAAQGYTTPTEVQMVSLPLLLEGGRRQATLDGSEQEDDIHSQVDLIAVAPTGSGKTLAFMIPVLDDLIRQNRLMHDEDEKSESTGTRALIVVPTKELVNQIVNEGRKLSKGTGIKIAGIRKGMKVGAHAENHGESESDDEDQEQQYHQNVKADVLVSTPLALVHALDLDQGDSKTVLPYVRHLVLDEADVLLDPLFQDQTLALWNLCSNSALRLSFWSATMGSSIEELIERRVRGRDSQLVRLVVGIKDSAVPNVSHRLVYAATEPGKLLALRQLLHPSKATSASNSPLRPPILVFTQTISRAIALHSELLYDIPPEAGGSSRIAVLHSDLSDAARDRVMAGFRQGDIWVLITTDLLSRGVDFRGVNGVVNYDVPTSAASYVHRAGRTGRAGREGGVVVTLYTVDDIPHVKNVANVIAATERSREDQPDHVGLPKWLLEALPKPSKADKKRLKRRGVESRRNVSGGQDENGRKSRSRISTKSGYDRRLEHRRYAVAASKPARQEASDDEWNGFDD
ncbi:MAG: hypothetical protein M1823_004818 [Watsoniomyces obsoletus]|nr:MAG: hypothetical protein M1823_004818 [Watsoniomyces obsoletus]